MAHQWRSIKVELIEGNGEQFWPRPGREIAAARLHTFEQLAQCINEAFGRWDLSHGHAFEFADGLQIELRSEQGEESLRPDSSTIHLSRLRRDEQFVFIFDQGEWVHLCTVTGSFFPLEVFNEEPHMPLPIFGWGMLPDQYGRRWLGDTGEQGMPENPGLADLPPLRPGWGRAKLIPLRSKATSFQG